MVTDTDPKAHWARPGTYVLAAVFLTLCNHAAWAHTGGESHRAIVSVDADKVRALVMMQIPAGRRAENLILRHDLDRDGKLGPLESQMLGARLGPEVVGGWVLINDQRAVAPGHLDVRCTISHSGSLLIALLMEYPLPEPGTQVGVKLLRSAAGTGPARTSSMVVELQAPAGIKASSRPVSADAPVLGPMVVEPGGASVWIVPGIKNQP